MRDSQGKGDSSRASLPPPDSHALCHEHRKHKNNLGSCSCLSLLGLPQRNTAGRAAQTTDICFLTAVEAVSSRSGRCAGGGRRSLFLEDHSPSGQSPNLWPPLDLNHLLIDPVSTASCWELGLPRVNLRGTQFSP